MFGNVAYQQTEERLQQYRICEFGEEQHVNRHPLGDSDRSEHIHSRHELKVCEVRPWMSH